MSTDGGIESDTVDGKENSRNVTNVNEVNKVTEPRTQKSHDTLDLDHSTLNFSGELSRKLNRTKGDSGKNDKARRSSLSEPLAGETENLDFSRPERTVDTKENDNESVPEPDVDVVDSGREKEFEIEIRELECQFFGSFYNEKQTKEPVADLVKFSKPCRICEIRVIPLGATVEMLDGVALLGSTNPTHFDLELYYQDLTDPGHSAFKEVGKLSYDHKMSIQVICGSDEDPVITDKVLVRGTYNSITLAIIGYEIENFPIKEPIKEKDVILDVERERLESPQGLEAVILDKEDDSRSILMSDCDDETKSQRSSDARKIISDDEESQQKANVNESIEIHDDEMRSRRRKYSIASIISTNEEEPIDDLTPLGTPSTDDLGKSSPKRVRPSLSKLVSPYLEEEVGFDNKGYHEGDSQPEVLSKELHEIPKMDTISLAEPFVENDLLQLPEFEVESVAMNETTPVTVEPITSSPIHCPVSPLEMEEISDGDISSAEDMEETTQEEAVAPSPLPETPRIVTPPKSPSLTVDTEESTEAFRREQDMEDEFVDDLEVISDDEIHYYSDSEADFQPGNMEDLIPEMYGRPLQTELTEKYSPKNLRYGLYPKLTQRNEGNQRDKINMALAEYTPENFKIEILELWLETVEEILPALTTHLRMTTENKHDGVLCFWVRQCFTTDSETSPEAVTRNLRKLKIGLKLAIHLCDFNSHFTNLIGQLKITKDITLQGYIANLLTESKVPSIECLCVRALETTMNTCAGFDLLTEPNPESGSSIFEHFTGFLVDIRLNCFVNVVLGSLYEKIQLWHVLKSLQQLYTDSWNGNHTLELSSYLDIVLKFAVDIERRRKHVPLKPVSTLEVLQNRVDTYTPPSDSTVNFVKILVEGKFITSCLQLKDVLPSSFNIISTLVKIFQYLLKWEVGIVYLAEFLPNELLKVLRNAEFPNSPGMSFALYYSQCMTVLKFVDLCSVQTKISPVNNAELLIEALLEIYMLLAYDSGKQAITCIFTTGSFIESLLDIVRYAEASNGGDRIVSLEKVALGGYAIEILIHIIQTATSIQFLFQNGGDICRLLESFRDNVEGSSKLKSVVPFLKPTLTLQLFNTDGIEQLCDLISTNLDSFLKSTTSNYGITPEIVTCLRILDGLAKPSSSAVTTLEEYRYLLTDENTPVGDQIRFKLVCVFMNSKDILSLLGSILRQLSEEYKQQVLHAHIFIGGKGEAITALLSPLVRIIRNLLAELLLIRSTIKFMSEDISRLKIIGMFKDFRDLTLVPLLLDTYSLLNAFPATSSAKHAATKVKTDIIACLQTYTIPLISEGDESDEKLMNSIWTKMISELISYTMYTPSNFIPGMTIFSQLQPLRLPVLTVRRLPEWAKSRLICLRKLWSAFLHGVTTQFQEMIGILCESTNRDLLILVRRVCLQISDLSAVSCLVACRGIMEPIVSSIGMDLEENSKTGSDQQGSSSSISAWVEVSLPRKNLRCSPRTSRLLGFLSCLMRKSGIIKAGIMQVIKGGSKMDEKFSEFLILLASILNGSGSEDPLATRFHVKSQSHVLSILHSLCNAKLNMFTQIDRGRCAKSEVDAEYIKANSLPPKDAIHLICSNILSFLASQENLRRNVELIRKVFFVLNVLCETEYCFYHLRICLGKNPNLIHDLMQKLKINELPQLDIVGVMETLEIVDGILKFLQNLITPQTGMISPFPRSSILTKTEFRKLLGWSSQEPATTHPLVQLSSYLRISTSKDPHPRQSDQGYEEQQYLKTYMVEAKDKLDQVLGLLNSDIKEGSSPAVEVVIGTADSLQDQFTFRPIVLQCEFKDPSKKIEYLSSLGRDAETDFEVSVDDLVLCNLLETVKECTKHSEVELMAELRQFYNEMPPSPEVDTSTNTIQPENKEDIKPTKERVDHAVPLLSTKPQFLRGTPGRIIYGRGLLNTRGTFDPFRSRPPNTSRPPSLHVDDFVAMESSSQGSSSTRRSAGLPDPIFRGRGGIRGTPSPLSRLFHLDRGRGFRPSLTSNPSFFPLALRNDPMLSRGRTRGGPGRNFGEPWQPSRGDNSYGARQDDDSRNYEGRSRHYNRSNDYRDQIPARHLIPSSNINPGSSQRWRNKPKPFNR